MAERKPTGKSDAARAAGGDGAPETGSREADARAQPHGAGLDSSFASQSAGEPAAPPIGALVVSETCWVPPQALRFTFSRSSGPGGQAVNKVNTRAQLRVAVIDVVGLSDRARARLRRAAGQRLTADGEILIQADEHRSQRQNKGECENRLRDLIAKALIEPRRRKKTKPSKASKERRLKEKKRQSEKKQKRREPGEHGQ